MKRRMAVPETLVGFGLQKQGKDSIIDSAAIKCDPLRLTQQRQALRDNGSCFRTLETRGVIDLVLGQRPQRVDQRLWLVEPAQELDLVLKGCARNFRQ